MTDRDPGKLIVELFGAATGEKQRRIDGVVLADGTQLLAEQVEPWQWEAAGLTFGETRPLNRAERRAAGKGH